MRVGFWGVLGGLGELGVFGVLGGLGELGVLEGLEFLGLEVFLGILGLDAGGGGAGDDEGDVFDGGGGCVEAHGTLGGYGEVAEALEEAHDGALAFGAVAGG